MTRGMPEQDLTICRKLRVAHRRRAGQSGCGQETLNGLASPGLIVVGSGSVFVAFAAVAAPGGVPISFDVP